MEKSAYEYDPSKACGCQIACGCIKFRRRTFVLLDYFNNSKGVLFVFCLTFLVHTAVANGVLIAVLTTLEKRFHLTSHETGFIFICYDIGAICSILVVTYFGGRGHMPLWIGWGCFIVGMSFLLFSLPHFLAPLHEISNVTSSICDIDYSSHCENSSLRSYRIFFIAACFFNGVGSSPFYTLGITYLDANVKQSHSSTYNGIIYGATSIGSAVGFVVGGILLKFYTDMTVSVSITEEDADWVGNWWLGFVISGISMIIFSLPLMMFPKKLPNTEKLRLNRENEVHQAILSEEDKKLHSDAVSSVIDVPRSFKTALCNPVLLLLSVAAAFDCGVMTSVVLFGPKYMESIFGMTSSTAGISCGIVAIICATAAYVGGGIVITKWKMKFRGMIKLCTVCSILATGIYMIYLLSCDTLVIAGLNEDRDDIEPMCKSMCGCSIDTYSPICSDEGITYLSHCDMECSIIEDGTFINCTGMQNNNTSARSGRCKNESCKNRSYIFLLFAGIGLFATFLKAMPGLQASLRSVTFKQRSFSIGVQWIIIRLFGQIPMPIIAGKVLDLTCLVWDRECGECGACKVYDNKNMSINLTFLHTIPLALGGLCYIGALAVYKPPAKEKQQSITLETKETHIPD